MNTTSLQDEILNLHSCRPVRSLKAGDSKLIDKVIRANIEDQGSRSRLTEIMIQCSRVAQSIDNAIDAFRDHCILTYPKSLGQFKTKGERENAIYASLREFRAYVDELMTIHSMAELVVKDIDQAGFSLKRTVDAMSLHFSPERKL